MRNTNKKGFTIVELVVVVAVIAILAAVLIPTFSGIIRKANISSDTVLAKNLNNALAIENVENEIKDFYDVIDALAEHGYVITNLNAKANECYFAWEKETNQIILVDGKDGYKVIFAANKDHGAIDDSWYFAINDNELAKKVEAAYPKANVFTSFETPGAAELSAPLDALKQLNDAPAGKGGAASDNLYIALETNGATVTEIKIGDKTYGANDTFKVSIGQNEFLVYNYFKTINGKVSIPAVLVAFDSEAKYGVVGGALVMTTGINEKSDSVTENGVYLNKNKIEKNANGQYVVTVEAGTKNHMLCVSVPGATADGYYVSKKPNGYGFSGNDSMKTYAGTTDGYGYGTYLIGYNQAITAEHDGMVRSYTVYFSGIGYVSFDVVIDVQ